MSRGEEYLAKEVAAAAERLRRLVSEANSAMAYLAQLGCEVRVSVVEAPPRLAVTVAKRIVSIGSSV